MFKFDYENMYRKKMKNKTDIEEGLGGSLLNKNICHFCYENKEKKVICEKCEYEICKHCYNLYIYKYKYRKCPHCRNTIIKGKQNLSHDDHEIQTSDFCFKYMFLSALSIISLFLGAYITKNKEINAKLIIIDFCIGFLFLSPLFICVVKYL
tara:strand:- start:167 stop:622 length:456 start_codon:yes stop_codon:yes gene_type:complete